MSYLYVRDVAAQRAISISRARAWLAELEREHGAKVVGRVGRRMVTTASALATVVPSLDPPSQGVGIEGKLQRMRHAVRAMRTQVAKIESRLVQLENSSPV